MPGMSSLSSIQTHLGKLHEVQQHTLQQLTVQQLTPFQLLKRASKPHPWMKLHLSHLLKSKPTAWCPAADLALPAQTTVTYL